MPLCTTQRRHAARLFAVNDAGRVREPFHMQISHCEPREEPAVAVLTVSPRRSVPGRRQESSRCVRTQTKNLDRFSLL